MSATVMSTAAAAGRRQPRLAMFLAGAAVVVVWYLWRFVRPYASVDPLYYAYFWPWRYALWAHLAGGLTALLIGPLQLWLGLTRQHLRLHRLLGRIYLGAAVVGLTGAAYLIVKELPGDWAFAGGLLGLACAWTLTTAMGCAAVRLRRI